MTAARHSARLQRVAADREEVGLRADALPAQHLLPHRLQLRLQLAGGRHVLIGRARAPVRRRQRGPADLAVRQAWHGVQRHDHGRHHVRRQPRPDRRHRGCRLHGGRRHIGHQALGAGGVLQHNRHRQLHAGRLCEGDLDLPELDAHAQQLDLHASTPSLKETCNLR